MLSIDQLLCFNYSLIILTFHILSIYFRECPSFFISYFFPDEMFLPALTIPLSHPPQTEAMMFGIHCIINALAAGNTIPTNLILRLSKKRSAR